MTAERAQPDSSSSLADQTSCWWHYEQLEPVQLYVNLSQFWYIFLAVITTVGLLVSLISNMIIIYLFTRTQTLRKNPSNIIAVNLSLSDLLYCIQWPSVIYCSLTQSTWILEYETVCQTFGFITVSTALASILTVLAMSVERAYVISRSIRAREQLSIRGAWLITVTIWLVAMCSCLPPLFGRFNRFTLDPSKTSCTLDYLSEQTNYKLYILVLYVCFWIAPAIIISISYILIVVTFKRSSLSLRQLECPSSGMRCSSHSASSLLSLSRPQTSTAPATRRKLRDSIRHNTFLDSFHKRSTRTKSREPTRSYRADCQHKGRLLATTSSMALSLASTSPSEQQSDRRAADKALASVVKGSSGWRRPPRGSAAILAPKPPMNNAAAPRRDPEGSLRRLGSALGRPTKVLGSLYNSRRFTSSDMIEPETLRGSRAQLKKASAHKCSSAPTPITSNNEPADNNSWPAFTNSNQASMPANAANSQLARTVIQFRLAKMSFYLILLWLVSWTPIASLAMINSVVRCHRASATAVFMANTMTKLGPAFDVFIYGVSHPKIKSKFKQIFKWLCMFGNGPTGTSSQPEAGRRISMRPSTRVSFRFGEPVLPQNMGALAWIFWTFVWGSVGIGLRSFVPKGPNQGIIQTGLALSAVCCYLLWLCAYMSQMNPLFGPQLNNITLTLMSRYR